MEYYLALKKEENSDMGYTWMSLMATKLSKTRPAQKRQKLYVSTYMRFLEESNSATQEVEWCYRGWEEEGTGSYCSMGVEFQSCRM